MASAAASVAHAGAVRAERQMVEHQIAVTLHPADAFQIDFIVILAGLAVASDANLLLNEPANGVLGSPGVHRLCF